ncbi:MAG: efflux RND transporter permease subunit [Phycisphaerales bacterium]|nr:MAG: efflux RND transporter permease subunit [Phycisphaerales bacterium]
MLDDILRFILRQRFLVLLLGAIVLLFGGFTWIRMPIDAFPDVTNVQVMILTEAPGLSPEEVERLITFPIETQMSGLPDVRQVRSLSQSGLSQVVTIFEDDVDTYFARQLVFERLAMAGEDLPEGIEPELGPISTGLGEIYQYTVEANYYCTLHKDVLHQTPQTCPKCARPLVRSDVDLMGLRTIQEWLISPQLRRLPGINEVNSMGGFARQFHVIVDPTMLLKFRITLRDVIEAIEQNNRNAGAGFIVKDFEQINVVSRGLLKDTNDIEQVVIEASDGTPVYISDLAEVKVAPQVRTGAASRDGRGEAVVGMTIMLKGQNSKLVVDRVKREIPEIQKSLPAGVRINPFYDRTDLIQACIKTVSRALAQGGLFVILILFILLWDLRAALTVALSLPLTAAATFALMDWREVTANLMSLGGLVIAVGMVVDAAIIVTENITRHMGEETDTNESRVQIALRAVREVARPVTFAVLIMVVVFVPLFALQSLEGKMFKPLALTICFALLSSLAVSLTVVPVLASMITRRVARDIHENPFVRLFHKLHVPALRLALKGRWITVAVAGALMVGAISMFSQLGTEFLPDLDEGAIAINLVRLPTAGLDGSVAQAQQIEKRLMEQFPDEIQTIVSKTGRAEISEDPMGPEQSDLIIMLKPKSHWTAADSKSQLIEKIETELKAFPGIRPAFSQPIALRVNELISGIKSDVALKIFGDDMDVLRSTAESIAPILAAVDGARDVAIEQVSGFSQYDVELDRRAMARHKINAETINELLEVAVGGKTASTLYESLIPVDIVVRMPPEVRASGAELSKLLVWSPLGYKVPLDEVARVRLLEAPAKINREDSRRRLLVECNVRGRDIGGFVGEAKSRLAQIEAGLPAGYRLVWGGQFENQQRAMERLAIVVPIALLLIFVMLVSALKSAKSASLIMVNLPFAVIGGIATMYLFGINLSVAATIGFIAVLGVAVEDGLVLISFCDQLRARGMKTLEAVDEACRLRVRPLVMTTATTLLGLLPMLYTTGAGSEIQKPLVAVIFGGMISSLVLELIVLPVLYALINDTAAGATRPDMATA